MKFSGIDLHSNNAVVAVIDDQDRVLYCKRLTNDLGLIVAALAPYQAELEGVVVEATFNWYWLVDGLMAAGFAVHLANTAAIKQYEGLKYAGDERDAVFLAHIFRLGLLPEGYIYPPQERALRDLARKRLQLVQQRTLHILSIESLLARQINLRMNGEHIQRMDDAAVHALALPPHVERAMMANMAVLRTLRSEITALETILHQEAQLRPEFETLKSTPGIGNVLAATIMLETGTITRFADVGHFSSYCRCVDSKRISNGKKKGEGNVKNGNKYLAWAFIEAAAAALRCCPQARRFYERKKAKRLPVVAMKALAHKLARAAYYMMRDGKPFEVKRCFS
ncbi:IS110 family transposase ISShwo5 [Paraburkholderia aspalathi]|uniref:IS110 family transposase n=1 Tax=Paraburkholderia aspalathi TaxID=1324617 RepID=UPI001B29F070|nr:IS110 family transposase [Paraburkholderia aspalathi]CAE6860605.1 IS110 family transposase ISShwo5 [Paraburkholderia aspalathi]